MKEQVEQLLGNLSAEQLAELYGFIIAYFGLGIQLKCE